MQTWKIKKRAVAKPGRKWAVPAVAIFMLLATLATGYYDFFASEKPFRLGLDLQGGTHLVYEADMKEIPDGDREAALEGVKDVIERRVNSLGVSEPVVQTTTTNGAYRVIIELAGVLDVNSAIAQIGETPVLEFKEPGETKQRELTAEEKTDLLKRQEEDRAAAGRVIGRAKAGEDFASLVQEFSTEKEAFPDGIHVGLIPETPKLGALVKEIQQARTGRGSIHWRVIESEEGLNIVKNNGLKQSPEMQLSHVLVCFEGKKGCQNPITEIEASIRINNLKQAATAENFTTLDGAEDLGWVLPGQMVPAFDLAAIGTPVGSISNPVETDFGYHLIFKRDERVAQTYELQRILMPLTRESDIVPVSPWKNTELSGKHLKRAQVQFQQNLSTPIVGLEFNEEGGDLFAKLTAAQVGNYIGIFLDGEPISIPRVDEAIYGGQAVIQGKFTLEEARLLSQRLNAGALPVPVSLVSQQTVGPALGAESLQKSVQAAFIGFGLIALFMIIFYRLPGFIASLALVLYVFLNFAAYRIFGVTITLAGIAGFVLSMGMAVDANVLILERFKEEYASGRDFVSSLDEGFKRAWAAIRDGNVTTLIATFVLFYFSTSFIKGFALTLSIGVLLSMFTAVSVSRVYMKSILGWNGLRKPWLFSVKHKKEV